MRIEDNYLALSLTPSELTLIEGESADFTAKLLSDPGTDQTFTLTSSGNITFDTNTSVTGNQNTLTFTSGDDGNWNQNQTVKVTSTADSDKNDSTAEIQFSSTNQTQTPPLPIKIYEEVGLTVSPSPLNMNHERSELFSVRLATLPTNTRKVNLTTSNTKMTVSPASLTFTPSNWNQPRNVLVTSPPRDNDTRDSTETITFKGTVTTTGKANPTKNDIAATSLSVHLEDLEGVILSRSELSVLEGSTATFTVVLGSQPSNSATLNLTSDNTDVTLSAQTLSFTRGNWNVPQTVTVSAAHDDDSVINPPGRVSGNETAEITVRSSGYSDRRLSVSVIDDDVPRVLVEPTLWVMREGDSIISPDYFDKALFSNPVFSLSQRPSTKVQIVVRQRAPASNKIHMDYNRLTAGFGVPVYDAGNRLVFNWNTGSNASIALRALEDDDTFDDEYQLELYSYENHYNSTGHPTIITLRVLDNDSFYPVLSRSSLTVTEGANATFKVKLRNQPSQNATLTLTAAHTHSTVTGDLDISVSPASLTFTDANWNKEQTVTVTAAQDSDTTPDRAKISFGGTGLRLDPEIFVSVEDNDIDLDVSRSVLRFDEGTSNTFTVRLMSRTVESRTLTLTSSNPDVVPQPASLTFTRANWNLAQTVTLSAVEDDDTTDDAATISISEGNLNDASLTVDVYDNDIGLTLSATSLDVIEGDTHTLAVQLDTPITSNRRVDLTSDNADITIRPTSLTFTQDNWSTSQNVSLTLDDDADEVPDTAVISLSGGAIIDASVSLSITDDDLKSIIVEPTVWEIREGTNVTTGDNADFTYPKFKLNSRLTQGYTQLEIRQTSADGSAPSDKIVLGGDDGVIGFRIESSEWNTLTSHIEWSEQVHLQALDDDDQDDDEYSLTIKGVVTEAGTREYVGVSTEVTLRVLDDDLIVPVPSATTLPVAEGGSKALTVKLRQRPNENVLVALESTHAEVALSTASLIFTPSNWDTPQEVTVTAASDSDTIDDQATINLTGAGSRSIVVSVPVRDDDIDLILSASTLSVAENGSGSFTVRLDTQPTHAREVVLTSDNADVTTSPATLEFTADNWNTAQTVTVSAADDNDRIDDTASISLGGDGFGAASVAVTASDDDIGLTLSAQTLTVSEGGSSNLTVRLDHQPIGTRTITPSSGNADVTFSPASLEFTADDWNTVQTLAIGAAEDADKLDEATTVSLTAGGGISPAEVALTVDDNDIAPTLSAGTLLIIEGASASFTVKLDTRPISERTLSLTSDNADVTLSPASLSFDDDDWDTAQTVTVSTASDADKVDDSATLRLTGNDVVSTSVAVKVSDDDIALALNPATLSIVENATATFTVQLSAPPTQNRIVSLTMSNDDITLSSETLSFTADNWNTAQTITLTAANDTGELDESATLSLSGAGLRGVSLPVNLLDDDIGQTLSTSALIVPEGGSAAFTVQLNSAPVHTRTLTPTANNTDVTFSPASLSFTADNWNTAQTFTVSAAEDADTGNESVAVSLSDDGVQDASLAVTLDDNDITLTLSSSPLDVIEATPTTFTVALAAQPAGSRTVALASDSSGVTLSPASLNFTNSNWSTAQTVTVNASDDADQIDSSAEIALTGAGFTDATLAVTVLDDDLDVIASATSLRVNEGDSTSLAVRLSAPPTNDRTVTLTSGNADVTFSPATLTFTAMSWSAAQTVTISAAQDADRIDDNATVSLSGNGGESVSVPLFIRDDDTRRVIVTPTVWEMREGDKISTLSDPHFVYPTFRLSHQPSSSVQLWVSQKAPASPNIIFRQRDTVLTRIGNGLPANIYDQERQIAAWGTFSMEALHDNDTNDNEYELEVVTERFDDDAAPVIVTLRVLDDDIVVPVLSRPTLSLIEGESGIFTVRLRAQPSADITLNLSSNNDDVTLNRSTLSFTTTDWNTAKTVRVNSAADDDSLGDTAQITVSSANASEARSSQLTVYIDDQNIGLTLTPQTLTVSEGSTTSFTAQLALGPLNERTVSLTTDNPDISLNPSTLSFSASNWNVPQTIEVSSGSDEDKTDDTATITLNGSGVVQNTVALTVYDDDIGYTLTPSSLTVDENDSGSFTVQLDTQPTDDRTVTLTSDNADVTLSPASLTFTSDNWNTVQIVTVSAAADDDGVNDSATITLGGAGTSGGSLAVKVDDDDIGLTLSKTSLSLAENDSQSFTVQLASEPIADRSIALTSDNTDVTPDQTPLTFTSDNWDTPQTVTLSAAQDDDKDDEDADITLGGSGVGSATLAAVILDDDISYTLTPSTLTLAEGGAATFTVQLDSEPDHDRAVRLTWDNADITLSPVSLNFTEDDWDTAQTVTVNAASDTDKASDSATITLAGDGTTSSTVAVTVSDDDIGYILSPTSLTVDEGAAQSFTLRLDTQPSGGRTVLLSSDSTEVTLDKTRVSFTETDWSTPQSVTVSAAHDADRINDTANISLAGTGLVNGSLDVTVAEDDLFALTLSASTLTLNEGGSGSFTVRPAAEPPSDLTVALRSDSTDVTLDETSLTFTPGNWSSPRTVTVSVGQDGDADDARLSIHLDGEHVRPTALTVAVTDDDISHTLTPSALTALEGGSAQFTVQLDAQPDSPKILSLTSDNTDVTLDPAALSFTPINWSITRTVTVSAGQDADGTNDSARISLDGENGLADGSLTVTVHDDDIALLPSVSSIQINEGASGSFTVRLSATPTSAVTVTLASDNTDVTISQTSLSFNSGNWNSPKTVTVSAGHDADNVNDSAQISLSSSIGASASVQISVHDDERAVLVLSATDLGIVEGTSGSFTVQLQSAPPGSDTVTVRLASDSADVNLDAASLDFTSANWNSPRTVTVSTDHDINDDSEQAKISLSGDGVVPASVAVTVADDDIRLVLSSSTLVVDEGQSKDLGIRLSAAPSANLSLSLTSDSSAVTLGAASLNFTPTDWSTAKTVSISAAQDADSADGSARISMAATAPVPLSSLADVTVADDEISYVLTPTSLTVAEGASATFTVKLSAQPSAERTITLTSTNPDVVPSPASLDFTGTDWNTAQTISVSAARDGDITDDTAQLGVVAPGGTATSHAVAVDVTDDGNIAVTLSSTLVKMSEGGSKTFTIQMQRAPSASVTISLTASNPRVDIDKHSLIFTPTNWDTAQTVTLTAFHDADKNDDSAQISVSGSGVATASVSVEVTDDDSIGLTLSSTLLRMSEGASRDLTVQLKSAPTENMTVRLASSNSEVSLDNSVLQFTPSNWNTPQTVTVTAVQDNDANDEFDQIGLSGDGIRTAQVAVEVTDDDSIRLSLSATRLSLDEGASTSFTVHLIDRPPAGSARVDLASTLSSITVSPASLSFTSDSWSNPQTVTVSAAQDADKIDDSAVVNLTGSGVKAASVAVQVLDNDNLRLNLSATRLNLDEGTSATFSVSLRSAPDSSVLISLASSESSVTLSATSLTFNTGNWSRAQTVTVRAAQDDNKNSESAQISLTSPDVATASVAVEVADDDSTRLSLSASQLSLGEGTSATFTVQLSARPDGDVTVKLASTHAGVALSSETLTFNAGNWNRAQTVTVQAAQDADKNDESAQISLTGSGVTTVSVAVSVSDDDRIGLTLSSTLLRLGEGASASFTVQLQSAPIADTVVSLTSSNSEVTLGASSLTFTAGNWNTPQSVTLTAVQDGDGNDDSAQIRLAGSGITPASVSVEVTDDDTIRLNLSNTSLRLTEGGSGRFTVSLQSAPSAAVTVGLTSSNSAVTLGAGSLNFTPANWSTPQTVTLSAAQDDDALNGEALITLAGDTIITASVTVTVADDDGTFLNLSSALLSAVEGGTTRFTVSLQSAPSAAVAISLSSSNSDVTLDKTALNFTASNWNTAQSVTLTTAQDSDSDNDSALISLTGEGVTPASVTVMVSDDDRARLSLSSTALNIGEGDTTRFTVSLRTAPNDNVSVSLSSTSSAVALSKTTLDFTTSNWSTPQSVTLTASQDDDSDNNTVQIDLAGAGVEGGLISVTVLDDDRARLNLSSTLLSVGEGDSTRFSVSLQSAPNDVVTVGLSTSSSAVTLNKTTLYFTTSDWSTAQSITLTAAHDDDSLDNTVQLSLSGTGVVGGQIAVTVQDDDLTELKLSSTLINVAEGGSSTFTVQLDARPSAGVKLNLSSTNSEVTLSPTSLNFTTADWNAPQTVSLSAAQDDDAVDDTAQIRISGAGVETGLASVAIADDDLVGLVLSSTLVRLTEGGSLKFSVELGTQPVAGVTVGLVSSSSEIALSPSSLSFTPANWNTAQSVTLTAGEDDDPLDDTMQITLSGDGVKGALVSVAVDDNDRSLLNLSSSLVTLDEGGAGTFTVQLGEQPTIDATIALSSTNSEVTVSPTSVSFTADNWNAPQNITISAVDDADAINDTGQIYLSGAGVQTGLVSVTVEDNDRARPTPSSPELLLPGGLARSFTVQLVSAPVADTTVRLAADNAKVNLNPTSLDFTTGNWEQPQNVMVSGERPETSDGYSVEITMTGIGVRPTIMKVTVANENIVGITLTGTPVSLTEGDTAGATFSVKLGAAPDTDRTITLTSDNTDVTIDTDPETAGAQNMLTFTAGSAGNWNTDQTVTVVAVHDDDRDNETATITLAGGGVTTSSVTVEVTDDDTGAAPEREREAAQLLLAEIAGGLLSSAGEVVGQRFDAARNARSAVVAGERIALDRSAVRDLAAGFASRAGAQSPDERRLAAGSLSAEWLGGIRLEEGRPVRNGQPAPSPRSAPLVGDFSYALSAAGGRAGWSVWGRTDTRDFSGGGNDIDLDGSQSHVWLGFDRRGDGGLLAGLAYTSSSADADYTLDGFSGSLETDLTAVMPYLEISGDNGARARITIGIGSGEATSVQTRTTETTADLSMQLLAVSGSWPMAELGNSTLSWSGDLGFSSVEAEADAGADDASSANAFSLDGLSASATRLRGGVELAHNGFGRDGSVAPRVALLLRHDGGDGLTGTGIELTAGLSLSIAGRISLDLNVRSLAMHSAEELSDWGAGLMLRGGSDVGGQGFAFSLGPHWGAHEDDLLQRQDAFELDQTDLQRRRQRPERGLMADFAYGLGALGGILTPYSELRFTSGEFGSMQQIAGVKFSRSDSLELRLFTERETSGQGLTQSRVRVEMQREF